MLKPPLFLNDFFDRIYLYSEALLADFDLTIFRPTWFFYNSSPFSAHFIMPFSSYILRVDVYSFFFLWAAIEHLRIVFYNQYIMSSVCLHGKPFVRRAFIEIWCSRHWFSTRRILHNRCNERFSIMFLQERNYAIINYILASRSSRTRKFSYWPSFVAFSQNNTLALLGILGKSTTLVNMPLFKEWIIPSLNRLFFLHYSYRLAKKQTFSLKPGTTHYYAYLQGLMEYPQLVHYYLGKALIVFIKRIFFSLYRELINSSQLSRRLLAYDFFNYKSVKQLNELIDFVNSRFCQNFLVMRLTAYFNTFLFLSTILFTTRVGEEHWYPFHSRRKKSRYEGGRHRFFTFAKRILFKLICVPRYCSSSLLGLEYFFWRVHFINYEYRIFSIEQSLRFPKFYLFIKLDIDSLLASRHTSLANQMATTILPSFTLYPMVSLKDKYQEQFIPLMRIDLTFVFETLKTIYSQCFNCSLPLSLLVFYLYRQENSLRVEADFKRACSMRFIACIRNKRTLYSYVRMDKAYFAHMRPDYSRVPLKTVAMLLKAQVLKSPKSIRKGLVQVQEDVALRYFLGFYWVLPRKSIWT